MSQIPNGKTPIHPHLRQHEWGPDCPWKECRKEADKGNFNKMQALNLGITMLKEYLKTDDIGWSLSSTHTFLVRWTSHPSIRDLTKKESGILFLGASDILTSLLFNTPFKWSFKKEINGKK